MVVGDISTLDWRGCDGLYRFILFLAYTSRHIQPVVYYTGMVFATLWVWYKIARIGLFDVFQPSRLESKISRTS